MASLIYCSSLRVLEKRIAEAAEALNDIRRQPDLSLEKVQIVCKTWSGLMLKMELDTRTLSCSQEEKEVLVACALKAADIFLRGPQCLGKSKGVMGLLRRLVRVLVICHTIYVEANTVGAVVQTLGEIDETTTETLCIGMIKVQLWTARRELEDAIYCIGGLENIRGMRAIISKIENGMSRLQQDANALNYMVMKIGEGTVPLTPTIVGEINITYTSAITELEAMRSELCRSDTSLIDQQETLRLWVEEKISTLIYLPPHSVPFPKAGEFYSFNY
jgi:hypothetical protein